MHDNNSGEKALQRTTNKQSEITSRIHAAREILVIVVGIAFINSINKQLPFNRSITFTQWAYLIVYITYVSRFYYNTWTYLWESYYIINDNELATKLKTSYLDFVFCLVTSLFCAVNSVFLKEEKLSYLLAFLAMHLAFDVSLLSRVKKRYRQPKAYLMRPL